jgi:hypothetical protein
MSEIITITNDINSFNGKEESAINSESILSLLNQINSDKKAHKKSIYNSESNNSLIIETNQNQENKNDILDIYKNVRLEIKD